MSEIAEIILRDLNPEQKQAVTAPDGPLLVFAGAGSGKTRVLTRRIAFLLTERDVRPHEILAVTFTNKAAGVMLDRVEELIGRHASGMWIHTFHGACSRILRSHAELVGRKSSFTIYDDGDQRALLKTLLTELDIDAQQWTPRQFATWFDRAKNEGLDPADYAADVPSPIRERYIAVAEAYRERVRGANAFDFGDLICETIRLLRDNEEVREAYRARFRHVLVDEFQDTNRAQYQLLALLLGEHRNLMVVGDDDQSIYRWRGARLANILEFEDRFPGAVTVVLGTNYRSSGRILAAADSVISRNENRMPKTLSTPNPDGAAITRYLADDEYDEARYVAATAERLRNKDGLRPSEIAVFYRINAQSRIVEEKLLERGIPYVVVGGTRFYDRKEIKDALAYLRLVANPADIMAFDRIVNVPPRGIGAKTLKRILDYARQNDLTPLAAAAAFAQGEGERIAAKARKALGELVAALTDQENDLFSSRPAEVAARVLEQSGYLRVLKGSDKVEDRARLDNLEELLKSIEDFEKDAGEEASLALFLEKTSLLSDPDLYDDKADSVSLMTLHSAKGLEYPAVFILGLEDGMLPHKRSQDSAAELEEERRLCYVGITRAEQRLFITAAARRSVFGSFPAPTMVSPYWHDLPADIVQDEGARPRLMTPPRPAWSPRPVAKPAADPNEPVYDFTDSQDPDDHITTVFPGQRVRHPQFGLGTVVDTFGGGRMMRADIRFDRVGKKTLVLLYANLAPA
jgi:ATP-dependent DNA helicase UvrD/PcrA